MANRSLFDILENERIIIPFWDDTMKLICIYGIASAMSYLHSKNIIHRDLKPDNVLLDEFLFPNVYDFTKPNTQTKYASTVSKYIEKFNKDELQNISKEAKKLSTIKHSTIQQFIGFSFVDFVHKKRPVIISEFCDKRTLFEIIENERKGNPSLNWNSTKKLIVIYGIAYRMYYLHLNTILHPNLNPTNIFIDDSFHPKLDETGLYIQQQNSKNEYTQSISRINFSQYYLAPEILESKSQTIKSDVYSFSLIVFEIMTNKIPFEDISDPNLIYSRIVKECYRPQISDQVPDIYRNLIKECWLQNSNERPSFSEIIDNLEKNERFITSDINKDEYFDYIESIKIFK